MQDKLCAENEFVCATCKNKIPDPGVIRCPRCYTLLFEPGCSGECKNCGGKRRKKPV